MSRRPPANSGTSPTDPTGYPPGSRQSHPVLAYTTRPTAAPTGIHTPHTRVRRDRVNGGNITLRIAGALHHIGIGRPHNGTRVRMLVNDLEIRVVHATTGHLIRALTIDPNRRYHGTSARIGSPTGPRKTKNPNPK